MLSRMLPSVVAAAAAASVSGQPLDGGAVTRRPGEAGARVSLGRDGFEVASADGRFSFDIGGRLHVDWTRHSGAGALSPTDGADVRRARIALGGRLGEAWRFSAEPDFAGDEVAIKDFWLAHDLRDGLRLTFGQQKQPYSLALEMSSNDLPFVERGIDNALLAPFVDRAVGARADVSGRRWFAAVGAFGDSIDGDDRGWGAVGRFILAPLSSEGRVLHLGIRAAYREPDSPETSTRIRDETTSFSDLSIVDTGPITGVENVTLMGPEAAFASGPFSVAGEYNRARVEHVQGDLSLDSWHVAATWSVTGESRAAAYDAEAGEFRRLEPAEPVASADGTGAWELAARYASIDLNDDFLIGGEERTLSLGANWYPSRNIRLMLDWTRILQTDDTSTERAAADGLDVVTLRAQLTF